MDVVAMSSISPLHFIKTIHFHANVFFCATAVACRMK